jgi:hypothetical protein
LTKFKTEEMNANSQNKHKSKFKGGVDA